MDLQITAMARIVPSYVSQVKTYSSLQLRNPSYMALERYCAVITITYGADMDASESVKTVYSSLPELGERIRSVMKRIGLDASVESTGKSGRTLDRYASGEVEPPLSVITGLATRAGCSIEWLGDGQWGCFFRPGARRAAGCKRHTAPRRCRVCRTWRVRSLGKNP